MFLNNIRKVPFGFFEKIETEDKYESHGGKGN